MINFVFLFMVLSILAFIFAAGIEASIENNVAPQRSKKLKYFLSTTHSVIRSIGVTFFAVGVVGILVKTHVDEILTMGFEDRIWGLFTNTPGIKKEVNQSIANANFIYRNFNEYIHLSKLDNGVLYGNLTAEWKVTNMKANTTRWFWHPFYSDANSLRVVKDSLLTVQDSSGMKTLRRWEMGLNSEDNFSIDIKGGKTITIIKKSAICIQDNDSWFAYLKSPCEGGMRIEFNIPDDLIMDYNFLHSNFHDTSICSFVKINSSSMHNGFTSYIATINSGILPFQGIWVHWAPKIKY
jgi:hypothetical protein